MADEPRRSVRATKGQNTKLDLLDELVAAPKKKSTKKAAKKTEEPEEEAEVIRCVCGAIETGDDEGEPWIACDVCDVWQHNICVGVSRFDEDAPDDYRCEIHNPDFPAHKELLAGLKKGKKVWEERRRKVEQEIAEQEKKASKKKGGKKGKAGKRASEGSELSLATNGKANTPSTPVPTPVEKKEPVARTASTKRKARDESHDKESVKAEPKAKIQKVSAAHVTPHHKSPPTGLPVKIIDLDSARQKTASFIKKNLTPTIKAAISSNIYTLDKDDTAEDKIERLAIQVEDAIFVSHPEKSAYNNQVRAVGFNLGKNPELCNGLLTRTLQPNVLANMTSDDMASKELKRETAKMKAASDKQSIMIQDDNVPRVRRTHKGEEVVEGDSFVPHETPPSTIPRRRSMLDPNADMATRSRENSPGGEVELPADIGNYRSRDDIRGSVPKQPLKVDTKPNQPPMRKASQADFDINKVFSSVQSPTSAQHHVRRQSTNIAPPANGPGVDPEIDKMLQDDDVDSPPYSPAEFNADPDIVWRGTLFMDTIADFSATGKLVAGADIGTKQPWSEVLGKDLRVAGRIDQEKANEYLCSLRYSLPTDVVVVAITPSGGPTSEGFKELFDYFYSKQRYGVLSHKNTGNVRDTYLVPLAKSPALVPDFIVNLQRQRIEAERLQDTLLVALVVRNEFPPEVSRLPDNGVEARSPSVAGSMNHAQRAISQSGPPPAMSPITQQHAQFGTPQGQLGTPAVTQSPQPQAPQPQQAHPFPPPPLQPQSQQTPSGLPNQTPMSQQDGELVARRILGPYLSSPTINFLMPQAYQMRPIEWEVVRKILERDEKARQDLTHLSKVLAEEMEAREESEKAQAAQQAPQ